MEKGIFSFAYLDYNNTKGESDRLGRRKYLGGCLEGSSVHMYCTLTVTVLYSLYGISDVSKISSATISKGPFRELEFLGIAPSRSIVYTISIYVCGSKFCYEAFLARATVGTSLYVSLR